MTNNIKALDINGVKVKLDSNTKVVHLYRPLGANTESLHDRATGADYQVPAGKKATCIYITSNDSNHDLYFGPNLNSTAGATLFWNNVGSAVSNLIVIAEAAANDYFTVAADEKVDQDLIIVIEESA